MYMGVFVDLLCVFVLKLKQMRREVELSRRRSIKLKAQVDKLQEQSQDGLVWSQHRELVRQMVQAFKTPVTSQTGIKWPALAC